MFDTKSFLVEGSALRVPKNVKDCIHALMTEFLMRIISYVDQMDLDRVSSKHVRVVMCLMSPEPVTMYVKNSLVSKDKTSTFSVRSMNACIDKAIESGDKYGKLDQRLVKACAEMTQEKFSMDANIACAAAMTALGQALFTSVSQESKTLSMDDLKRACVKDEMLSRFLHQLGGLF